MRTRLAIAGLGAVTQQIHLPAYRQLGAKIEVVAGCDPDAGARTQTQRRHPSIRLFAEFDEMLRAIEPDIAVICTPPALHHRQCLAALARGCHVFCEKPLVETLEQADELIAAAAGAGRQLVVNSQFPCMRIHAAAKKCIGTPEFGRLLHLHASQTFRPTARTEATWRGRMQRRLGFEFGVHVFELIRFFFDEEPRRIVAHMPNPSGGEVSDVLNLVSLEFADGRAASILLDRLSKGPERYLDLRLDGEHAAISTSIGGELGMKVGLHTRQRQPYFAFDFVKGGKAVWQDGNRSRVLAKDGLNPFASSTAYHLGGFIDALAQNTTPRGSARDHRLTLALIFAAYDSAAERRWVELAPYLTASSANASPPAR